MSSIKNTKGYDGIYDVLPLNFKVVIELDNLVSYINYLRLE